MIGDERTKHSLYVIVMILCFVYGGVSLLYFVMQAAPLAQSHTLRPPIFERELFERNESVNVNSTLRRINPEQTTRLESRLTAFYYTLLGVLLLGSIVSILAGVSIMNLLKTKERKELTKSLINTMTTPDEKKVLKELEQTGGELTQSEIVLRSGLSKVKVHRIIRRLEQLKIISKYPYGVTNKIKLEKRLDK
ncbi:MAG: winged helix-turn-helix transcriptional regulator [Nanoarchaeota archaeon]